MVLRGACLSVACTPGLLVGIPHRERARGRKIKANGSMLLFDDGKIKMARNKQGNSGRVLRGR